MRRKSGEMAGSDAEPGRAKAGRLSIVGTPIGNLADITLRALETLRDADLLLAEDTRRTRVLLTHHGIRARLLSLHAHNEAARVAGVLEDLAAGRHVALVSDAGMPSISDPGELLVRAAIEGGFAVEVVPGPAAVTAAVAVCGIPAARFAFEGFLPARAGERRRRLEALAADTRALVFYEAPHRLAVTLEAMLAALGDRRAAVARELTKLHEEVRRGTLGELAAHFRAVPPRGELTVVVEGAGAHAGDAAAREGVPPAETLVREVEALMRDAGMSRRDALREIARRYGVDRQALYRLFP